MPMTARTVIPDIPHHITQRGNNRQDVFFFDCAALLEVRGLTADLYGMVVI